MRLILYIIFLFPFVLSAQDRTMDSLKLLLKNAKHDTTRCNILNAMVEVESDDKVWPIYNEQLLKLADENSKTNSLLKSFYLNHLASAFNFMGLKENQRGDNPKALEYYNKSLLTYEEINNKKGIAYTLNNIATIYYNNGDIQKAIDYLYKSLKIQEYIRNKDGIATTLNNIGEIYKSLGDGTNALIYLKKSLKIREEIKDKDGICLSLNNIGEIYFYKNNLSEAEKYFLKGLIVSTEIGNIKEIASSLNSLGSLNIKNRSAAKALFYYQKSLEIYKKLDYKMGIISSNTNISYTLLKKGSYNDALNYGKLGLQGAKEIGNIEMIKNAANTLKDIYKKQNKYKEALEMYELEIQMRDSINNEQTKKASIKKQFQYEYEKKATADSVQHAEEQKVKNALLTAQQAQLKQEKTQRLALYGGLVLVIAFSAFVFNRFKLTQKQKLVIEKQKLVVDKAYTQLEEKNKEVLDSIHYAKRIQTALLTSEKYIERKLNELNK